MKRTHLFFTQFITIFSGALFTLNAIAQTPNWLWAKGAGGVSYSSANAVATDASGNVYVTGNSSPSGMVFGSDTLAPNYIFLAKYNPSGALLWVKGAGGYANANSVATDTSGNIYVAGNYSSALVLGAYTLTISNNTGVNIFLVKYDAAGNVLWAKSGASSPGYAAYAKSIATDISGNAYVAGIFANDTLYFGSYALTNNNSLDNMFLAKYDAAGNFSWAKSSAVGGSNGANSVTTDASGSVYVAGFFEYTYVIFGADSLPNATGGNGNMFLAKYDAAGNVLWARASGGVGAGDVQTTSVSADASGNVYVTGNITDTIIFNSDTVTIPILGYPYIFLAKYDAAGNEFWAKSEGGVSSPEATSVATDASGSVYVAGNFQVSPITFGSDTITSANNGLFLVKYDSAGNVRWAKGTGATDINNFSADANSIATDALGDVYVAGSFQSSSIVFGPDTLTLPYSGVDQIFLAKTGGGCNAPVVSASPDSVTCYGLSNGSVTLTLHGGALPYHFAWSNSDTTQNISSLGGGTYVVTVTESGGCTATATAVVNEPAPVIPAISISGDNNICTGASASFTAAISNGGSAPVYQWEINGVNTGVNSDTFTSSVLATGSVITCVLTSNAPCANPVTVNSNSDTMTVSASVTPTINISANQTAICAGNAVTFTASASGFGSAPVYQWKVNGADSGTGGSTFIYSPNNGDVISCLLTSNASCAGTSTAASNNIVISVLNRITPGITINAVNSAICAGAAATFTETDTGGGVAPYYQWKVNGNNAGANSPLFTSSMLHNGDIVSCVLTSSLSCAVPDSVSSNSVTMTVNPVVMPAINITGNDTVCAGTPVTFNAVAVNGGSVPVYQWEVNGAGAGANSSSFTSSAFNNGDVITCMLTSNAVCASPVTASGNIIGITVNPVPPAPVIYQSGDTLYSSAASGNQWYMGGNAISGANGRFYPPPQNGAYYVIATSSGNCSSDTSNNIYYTNSGLQNPGDWDIKVYPNPASDILFIQSGNALVTSVEIISLTGQTIALKEVNSRFYELGISTLADGSYLLLLHTNAGVAKRVITIVRD